MQKKRTIVGSYCLKPRFDWAETKKPAQPTTQLSARGSWSQVSAFQHHNLPLTISPEGTFCDTVQVLSSAGDMQLILIRD